MGDAEAMKTNRDTESVESLVEVSGTVYASEFGVIRDIEGLPRDAIVISKRLDGTAPLF